jgi:hypothetical protein
MRNISSTRFDLLELLYFIQGLLRCAKSLWLVVWNSGVI